MSTEEDIPSEWEFTYDRYNNGSKISETFIREYDLYNYRCSDRGLILPIINEYTWPDWLRGTLYLIGLLYCFLGVAIIADIFMGAIEKITSKTRKVSNDLFNLLTATIYLCRH